MTNLGLRPYSAGDEPAPGTVPVSVIVLTLNEEANIRRCMGSAAWAEQVLVVDSGSADNTVELARRHGADVVEQPWLGYSGQRDFALLLSELRHDWVYFLDADQWISPQLANEISEQLSQPVCAAYTQRLRLVFQGTWIRHCGWYKGSWNVHLMDRRYAKYDGSPVGERVCIDGEIRRLANDIVDEDRKSLVSWLHKHVQYAQLEAEYRGHPGPLRDRVRALRSGSRGSRPVVRAVLKDVVFPAVPAKPLALFCYMYLLRGGILDGLTGLRFCFYHAWYEASVNALCAESLPVRREVIS
jgi:glycosyltransferase involved in cell wall biosynthesis